MAVSNSFQPDCKDAQVPTAAFAKRKTVFTVVDDQHQYCETSNRTNHRTLISVLAYQTIIQCKVADHWQIPSQLASFRRCACDTLHIHVEGSNSAASCTTAVVRVAAMCIRRGSIVAHRSGFKHCHNCSSTKPSCGQDLSLFPCRFPRDQLRSSAAPCISVYLGSLVMITDWDVRVVVQGSLDDSGR